MKARSGLFDMKLLGNSVAAAKAMCKEDKVLERKARANIKWMKKNRISAADMAGCMH
jgi:hypothetical protein